MLTRPKARGHFRFTSELNDGSTQFNAYQNSIFRRGQVLVENQAKMAKPPRLVLEAYEELSLESRQYVKWRLRRTSWMAWLILQPCLLFYIISLGSTRATLPLCTRAHMQALMTRVGGDNLTIGCIFESTYYGPTPKVFTHIFAPQGPKDMFMPISPIYALFPINSVLQGLRC